MRCVPQLGLNMYTNEGDEEGCLWQAVSSTRGMAEHSECCAKRIKKKIDDSDKTWVYQNWD